MGVGSGINVVVVVVAAGVVVVVVVVVVAAGINVVVVVVAVADAVIVAELSDMEEAEGSDEAATDGCVTTESVGASSTPETG